MEYKVVVREHGTYWYKPNSNILHREGGPAIEYANGEKHWLQNGELHRLDGPAVIDNKGFKFWYLFGKEMSEQDVKDYVAKHTPPTMCDKVIEVDGIKYKLVKV